MIWILVIGSNLATGMLISYLIHRRTFKYLVESGVLPAYMAHRDGALRKLEMQMQVADHYSREHADRIRRMQMYHGKSMTHHWGRLDE